MLKRWNDSALNPQPSDKRWKREYGRRKSSKADEIGLQVFNIIYAEAESQACSRMQNTARFIDILRSFVFFIFFFFPSATS